MRGDHFRYSVRSDLAENSGSGHDTIFAPKLALAWQPADQVELYANYGESFHSNDVRGATIAIDPASGSPVDRVPLLVRARGGELGGRLEIGALTASAALFYLDLASELVFVGDAGATEPNPGSRRVGVEGSLFWRPTKWLTIDGSVSLTRARLRVVPADQNRIVGAVANVAALGAAVDLGNGLSTSVRLRHFGSAPLLEENTVRSDPTTVLNFGLYYRTGRVRLGADVLNVLDSKQADITYFYASRLPGEPAEGVQDRHFHPVEPRQLRASVRLTF